MIDFEFPKLFKEGHEIGYWLDQNMPNPPLPDEQRWTVGAARDGRVGIRFINDKDATFFLLRWA